MRKSRKCRPVGDVLLDMEPLLEELTGVHALQWSDVLGLVHAWLMVHAPHAREEFTDGTGHPGYFYGSVNGQGTK